MAGKSCFHCGLRGHTAYNCNINDNDNDDIDNDDIDNDDGQGGAYEQTGTR